jgi:nucleoside-diphosphate-sugar epimerase
MSAKNHSLPQVLDLEYVVKLVAPYWSELNNQTILITGGTGIIGKWMLATLNHARDLLGLNMKVVLLSRNPDLFIKQHPEIANKRYISWIRGDVRTFSLPPDTSPFWAIHAATDVVEQSSQLDVLTTCSAGTHHMVSQLVAANCKRILLLSSGAIYGKLTHSGNGISESYVGSVSTTNPESAYAEGKRYSELLCTLLAEHHNISIPMARCFAMVGPYLPLDKHFAIGNFIHSALYNQPIVIEGDGTPVRSYLYLADVAAQLWLLLFKGRTTAYNVGSNQPISIRCLAEKVINVLGSSQSIQVKNKALHVVHANSYYPDTTLIHNEFNITQTISIEDSILKTAGWYVNQIVDI